MSYVQHKEWFISSLQPHIHTPRGVYNKCILNERNLSISLHSINNNNILNHNTNRISILNNNNTLYKGGVGTLEVEDNN